MITVQIVLRRRILKAASCCARRCAALKKGLGFRLWGLGGRKLSTPGCFV